VTYNVQLNHNSWMDVICNIISAVVFEPKAYYMMLSCAACQALLSSLFIR